MHAFRRFHRLVILLAYRAADRRNATRAVMFVEHVHRVAAGVQGVAFAGVEGVAAAVPAFGLGGAFIDGPLGDPGRRHACARRQAAGVVGRLEKVSLEVVRVLVRFFVDFLLTQVVS